MIQDTLSAATSVRAMYPDWVLLPGMLCAVCLLLLGFSCRAILRMEDKDDTVRNGASRGVIDK